MSLDLLAYCHFNPFQGFHRGGVTLVIEDLSNGLKVLFECLFLVKNLWPP